MATTEVRSLTTLPVRAGGFDNHFTEQAVYILEARSRREQIRPTVLDRSVSKFSNAVSANLAGVPLILSCLTKQYDLIGLALTIPSDVDAITLGRIVSKKLRIESHIT